MEGQIDKNIALVILIFMAFIILLFPTVIILYSYTNKKKNKMIERKKSELKKNYNNEKIFFCDYIIKDGNTFQLNGEAFNTSITQGMKIEINGIEHEIKEVYGFDDTPEDPDSVISQANPYGLVLIESNQINYQKLKERLKEELVIPFLLR
ncbi:MAG: hypothetical protein KatS3mg095_0506 [Candidatus Parcubacteria bacterium]|nr:MAG: hypothetical protein KatS3mg095_0506 [Candidatus Parcubacteria bacterium]